MKAEKEQVNHPEHYRALGIETIDMMERIWGTDAVVLFCQMNAFKYRMRAGHKETDPQKDIDKALWYERRVRKMTKKVELLERSKTLWKKIEEADETRQLVKANPKGPASDVSYMNGASWESPCQSSNTNTTHDERTHETDR